jgi:predicted Rossmann-fold nucleotide-binding protein
MRNIHSICVFAGTASGKNDNFVEQAKKIGSFIASSRLQLVYGGGSAGIMGSVARSALASGGYVIGVLPESMMTREDTLTEANE